jgi:hypothetical protein
VHLPSFVFLPRTLAADLLLFLAADVTAAMARPGRTTPHEDARTTDTVDLLQRLQAATDDCGHAECQHDVTEAGHVVRDLPRSEGLTDAHH